ncbi:sensor domain-containing diguanylate cyclase [Pseudoalteromonas gelatinilytica]
MNIEKYILDFIHQSKDAYAVFSPDDKVIYCNETLEDLFCFSHQEAIGKTFNELIINAYEKNQGIALNLGNLSIEDWLNLALSKRRKRRSRMFEIDLVDGRWMLVTEELDRHGYLFLQAKNITRQKILESQLQDNLFRLNDIAMTDELTQISNRRCFIKSVDTQLTRKKQPQPYALVAIDIDDFKAINDMYGHSVGDVVLKNVAQILQSMIRPYDFVGRIGGEEFAIFLLDVDYTTSKSLAHRLVKAVFNNVISHKNINIRTSISVGLVWSDKTKSFEELYEHADEKLYESKATGKNKLTSIKCE